MTPHTFEVSITIPSQSGFYGRECNNPECKRYFKVHKESVKDEMYCPYCGTMFSNKELHTQDQLDYGGTVGIEVGKEQIFGQIDKMFEDLARKSQGNKFVKLTYKPIRYRAKPARPHYTEKEVDSEIHCPLCTFVFQVWGIFGFCPGCRNENLRIYDANLAIIEQEVAKSENPQRALRHAYADLVSTFEMFCKSKARRFVGEYGSFQELFEARKFFKQHASVDIFDSLIEQEILVLRRVFQKRNAYEHGDGVIEERFVRKIPEDAALFGTKAVLSLDEFKQAAGLLRRVLDRLARATE